MTIQTTPALPARAPALNVGEAATCPVRSESDIYTVIELGRAMASKLGFAQVDQLQLETIIVELASSALQHGGGCATLRCVARDAAPGSGHRQAGLEITVRAPHWGSSSLAHILNESHTPSGINVRVLRVSQLADEFAIDSLRWRGTRVRACKWVQV